MWATDYRRLPGLQSITIIEYRLGSPTWLVDQETHRAFEARRMEVVLQRFHPSIAGLDWETTAEALRREQLVPVFLAVGQTIFDEERIISKWPMTVGTCEASWVPWLIHCFQAVLQLTCKERVLLSDWSGS